MSCAVLIFVWGAWSSSKPIREDELLHLHDIWLVSQGEVPYRDFFEHHAPWYHYLLSPLAMIFAPESSKEAALTFVQAVRSLSYLTVLFGLIGLTCAGRLWQNWSTGLLAAGLITGVPFFLETAIETRPDIAAFALWMGSLALLWKGFNPPSNRDAPELSAPESDAARIRMPVPPPTITGHPFLWSGILLGSAVMFTQKMLFAVPGLGLGLLVWTLAGKPNTVRLASLIFWSLGFVFPTVITWAFFAVQGAGYQFVDKVFLINARWTEDADVVDRILKAFRQENWPLLALGALGACWSVANMVRNKRTDWFALVLILVVAGWFYGLLQVIPATDRQFYMIMLPPLALLAAHGIMDISKHLQRPIRAPILAIAVLLLIVHPIGDAWKNWRENYSLTLALWIVETTDPEDTFLDGWTGAGTFRPQAWYYGFVHPEVPPMIEPAAIEDLMDGLQSGRINPRVITNSRNLLSLHPDLSGWVRERYRLRYELFYVRDD